MHFFPTTIVNDYSKYKRETGYPSREKGMQKGKYFVSDKNTQSNVKIMITMMMITMMMIMMMITMMMIMITVNRKEKLDILVERKVC